MKYAVMEVTSFLNGSVVNIHNLTLEVQIVWNILAFMELYRNVKKLLNFQKFQLK